MLKKLIQGENCPVLVAFCALNGLYQESTFVLFNRNNDNDINKLKD